MSRVHEEWEKRKDASEAVVHGLASTGRVITAAATIMFFVFASFALGGSLTIKLFGVALASAVAIDAFIIRSILVPAIMELLGKRAWWLPGWLDRILPHLNVEAAPRGAAPGDEQAGRGERMTTEGEYAEKRWQALALLCIAQFMVVLDASIVNIALPTIGTALDFSQDNLSWVVNAYVLTFGGFLLLGGRLADLLGRRRVFMSGLILFAARFAGRRLRPERNPADHRPGRPGPRRGDRLTGGSVDHHRDLQGGRRAQQGPRRLGRRRRLRRRRRRAARRRAHRRPRLGMGALGQRPDRPDHRVLRAAADRREPVGGPVAELRHPRGGHDHSRAVAARLLDRQRRAGRLGVDRDDHR